MTISIDEYYGQDLKARKKEPQYIAFINKNSCTSCNSCSSMCPVDCIYEVPGSPAQSYHVIDTSRCIGCQMCYRVPSESTGPWTMEICPWNAIDLIYNPNFKEVKDWQEIWPAYFAGSGPEPDFRKLEELGYQLYLNRMIYAKKDSEIEKNIQPFLQSDWTYGEGNFAILAPCDPCSGEVDIYRCTEEGDALVDFLYSSYDKMFLD